MAASYDNLGVLETARFVAEHSQHVKIHLDAVLSVASRLAQGEFHVPLWNKTYHFYDGSERTVNYILVLDALNFSFWGEPQWRIGYRGEALSGYWALAAALKKAVEEGCPIWDATYLANLTCSQLEYLFRGDGQVPMLEERLKIAREVGRVLISKYGGWFSKAVTASERSALMLVRELVSSFPSFNDIAHYQGQEIRFYKRAQILVADLYGAFGGRDWGEFHDLEKLTAFADYKLPQMLRGMGILEYDERLAGKVDSRIELLPGGEEEVEIRANTLWAVEYLRQALAERGVKALSLEIDWYVWELGQRQVQDKPHHLTRTIYY